ncbi:TrmH family RNA methyltransferase [Spirochaeta africana]|uniref:rRNA methylase n=1 Tax=Spirochaeta africana (strain ATCC 700263 / DSM 8902 / Z-7692) TaxID=889378 RepID=H9UFP0_SPIAZ|nr:TrmH family RNA methyltransferase [Spirochaeta africana]AFG36333.1 rRNA methylase [Spirochaeta africana DSM 8902]
MIALRKLQRMPLETALRHVVRQLEAAERTAVLDAAWRLYLRSLLQWVSEVVPPQQARSMRLSVCLELLAHTRPGSADVSELLIRELNTVRHVLQMQLGLEPAEWDLPIQAGGAANATASPLRELDLYLDGIRSPFNLGSILRTAAALGVHGLLLSPDTVDPAHRRAVRSAMGCSLPLQRMERQELIESGRQVVALETGGMDIREYRPLQRDFVLVLGSEELGIHPELLQAADQRLSVPMYGTKASLNVGVAAGAALYAIMTGLSRVNR